MKNIKKCFVITLLLSGSYLQASGQKFDHKAVMLATDKKVALMALKKDKSPRPFEVQAHLNELLKNCGTSSSSMSDTYLASFSNTVLNLTYFEPLTFAAVKSWEKKRESMIPFRY